MTPEQPAPGTQAARLRTAIDSAVVVGRDFMRGRVDADQMAHTMTRAYQDYVAQEQAAGRDLEPEGERELHLVHALAELNNCGSGYLASRCDAA